MSLHDALSECHQDFTDSMRLLMTHQAASTSTQRDVLEQETMDADDGFDTSWASYMQGKNHGDKSVQATVKADVLAWRQIRDTQLLPASRANKITTFDTVYESNAKPIEDRLGGLFDTLRTAESKGAQAIVTGASSSYAQVRTITCGVLALAVLLGLALAGFIGRMIARPLQAAPRRWVPRPRSCPRCRAR